MAQDSTRKPTQLVLLDRDGVINLDSPNYIKSVEEWQPVAGSLAAIAQLNDAGIDTALCTNQSGISRGKLGARDLAAIHYRFSRELAKAGGRIRLWRFCPHLPEHRCSCRKPKTAMVDDCLTELGVESSATAFIGDSLKDMQVAISANCLPILVHPSNGREDAPATELANKASAIGVREIVMDLAAAAERILQLNRKWHKRAAL